MRPGIKSIVTNAAYLLGGHGLAITVRIVYAIVLTRSLGPELYGILNYGLAWYLAFLPMTLIGLPSILLRSIGRDRGNAVQLIPQTFTLVMAAALSVAGLAMLLAWSTESHAELRWLLALFSVALVSRSLAQWAHSIHVAHEAARHAFSLEALFRPLEVLLGIIAILLGGSLWAIALIHCGSWLLQAFASLYVVQRRRVRLHLVWQSDVARRLLAQGIPLSIATVCYVWFLQGTLIMARQFLPDQMALGQLALAVQILVIVMILPQSIGTAALPVVSRAALHDDGKERLFLITMLRSATLFGGAIALAGMTLGEPLASLVFGADYSGAGHLLGVVLWLTIPLAWGAAAQQHLISQGFTWSITRFSIAGGAVMTASFPWLTTELGSAGAPVSAAAGALIWALGLLLTFFRAHPELLYRTMLSPLLGILSALGVVALATGISPALSLLLATAVLTAVSLLAGILFPAERAYLRRLFRLH